MMTNKIPRLRPSVEFAPEDPFLSFADEDMAFLFYASLADEDLEEVFGDFFVPAEPIQ